MLMVHATTLLPELQAGVAPPGDSCPRAKAAVSSVTVCKQTGPEKLDIVLNSGNSSSAQLQMQVDAQGPDCNLPAHYLRSWGLSM